MYLVDVFDFVSLFDILAEIAVAPEEAREAADRVLAGALRLRVAPAASVATGPGCTRVDAGAAPAPIQVGPGTLSVHGIGSANAEIRLRRFATQSFPIGAGEVSGSPVQIVIPADRSDVPWQVQVSGSGDVVLCETPAAVAGTAG